MVVDVVTIRHITTNDLCKCTPQSHCVATAAAIAAEEATWLIWITFFQKVEPPIGFSGTTIVSPGPARVDSTFPRHNAPSLPLTTEPSARTIKIAPLFPR